MTLIVSVLVQDGIVLAGDSFAPLPTRAQHGTPELLPTNSISRGQTIFPFYKQFGIGMWKQDYINGKPAFVVMRELEAKFEAKGRCFNTVNKVVQAISEAMSSTVHEKGSFEYVVAGYSGQNAEIVRAIGFDDIGRIEGLEGFGPLRFTSDTLGCQTFGETAVSDSIDKLYGEAGSRHNRPFGVFALQTAIDYALFLIRTTIEFQKFSRTESTVGKAIDVAVVTKLEGFRWVRRQSTAAIL